MPRTRVRTDEVYTFEELDEDAKDKAREWFAGGVFDYEWYEFTYDDAKRVHLKITEFDCDRHNIKGHLTGTLQESLDAILKDHGKDCDSYKLATIYKQELEELRATFEKEDEDSCLEDSDEYEQLKDEFEHDLLEEYLSMLCKEVDYMLSTEYLDEGIIANEYEFTKEGKRA